MSKRLLLLSILCGSPLILLVAQQPPASVQQPPAKEPPQDLTKTQDMTTFKYTLQQVVAPVLVYDRRRNNIINGLEPNQFRLFDNGKEQNLTSVDVTYVPISMVIAVQANALADKILPQVNRIGAMLKPIILGDQGEAEVIAYDSRVRVMQPFTNDADDITKTMKNIKPGASSSRLIDAVEYSVHELSLRNKNRRRILLVIGEGRDEGSMAKSRETLEKLELTNVVVYWIDMSHLIGRLTQAAPDPRPDNTLPAMHPMPGGVPATPTTVEQTYGTEGGSAQFLPVLEEIFRDMRNVFRVSTGTLFTKGTGGEQFSFASQKGLESAITQIGDELHSQYLISYIPNNMGEGGFHHIEVSVIDHDYRCETKLGYYMSPKFQ